MDQFVRLYVGAGKSGSIALRSHLLIRLQSQLNVALPLGLLLGINLRGTRVRGQHNGGEKSHPNYSKVEVASITVLTMLTEG